MSEAQTDYAIANRPPRSGYVFPVTLRRVDGSPVGRDVYVVHVVGRGRAVVAVVPPALGGPHRRPDPVPPDDVVEVELGGVRLEEGRDLVAQCLVAGHDVDRLARGVLTVRVPTAVRGDLRERVAHRAVDQDGLGGQPVLDAAVGARRGRQAGRRRGRGAGRGGRGDLLHDRLVLGEVAR